MNFLPGPAMLLASSTSSAADRLINALFDDTFSGIHRLVFFDYAIMIPYFAILVVLSVYGLHRYEMIRGYWKHRKMFHVAATPRLFAEVARVTIQLQIYNEQYVVERLIEETWKIDYPRGLLQIQVLDDSTDETHPFTARLVEEYRAAGQPIEYIYRANRPALESAAGRAD